MKLSCVTASYVADKIGYPGDIDWGLAAQKIEASPTLETIDDMLRRLAPARLDGIELWTPHASPRNLTPVLASAIRRRLAERGMVCAAYAGGIPDPAQDPSGAEEVFQAAKLLGAPVIAGHFSPAAVPKLGGLCAEYGVRAAFENGGEKSVGEILAAIQGGDPQWVGANIDTGNLAGQGGDPVQAIRTLGSRRAFGGHTGSGGGIIHVHFKDVPAIGSHDCVAVGTGLVDVKGCIRELKAAGYDGWLSIEVETGDRDPTEEIIASAETLRRLWA